MQAPWMVLARELDLHYQHLWKIHEADKKKMGNRLPVGGDHMDIFFKLEGIRGMLSSLRQNEGLQQALEKGKSFSRSAVQKWNAQRKKDYQVHRWEETAFLYLENLLRSLCEETGLDFSA